jgi:hypothetical protein
MVTGRFILEDNTIKSRSGLSSTYASPGMTANFIQLRLSQSSRIFNRMEALVLSQRVRKESSRLLSFPSLASGSNQNVALGLCQVGALEPTGEFLEVLARPYFDLRIAREGLDVGTLNLRFLP